jgi:hypothetical protein
VKVAARPRRISFAHLLALTDGRGVFEHARLAEPRTEHGYCLDDVARALAVVVREPAPSPLLEQVTDTYLRFVEQAITAGGEAHNRMNIAGEWTDEPGTGDWWGRAVGALGATVASAPHPAMRIRASHALQRALTRRPENVRTWAFATLGAADLYAARPASASARQLIADAVEKLPSEPRADWDWPEERMRYANATLPEALIAAGIALGRDAVVQRGLQMLESLLAVELRDGHLSVVGHHGRGPGEQGPSFDQQPIEVAAMADACARAFRVTREPRWREGVRAAWAWFDGDNDGQISMVDESGGGYDGLEADGRNENRGAESTLAALGTFQRARELGIVPPRRTLR